MLLKFRLVCNWCTAAFHICVYLMIIIDHLKNFSKHLLGAYFQQGEILGIE